MYSAAALGPSGYLDISAMRAENARLGKIHPSRAYLPRPPVFVAATKPLSALPYFAALMVWRALCAVAVIASAAIWSRWNRSILLALAWSLPALWLVYAGQDVGFCLLAVSASLVIANPLIAGAVLGLAVFKWHLCLFLPVVLVAKRQWRMVAGAGASVGVLLAASFALCPDWLLRIIAMLRGGAMHPYFAESPGLRSLFLLSPLAFAALGVSVAALLAWACRARPLHLGVALALAAGCVVNAHSYAVDCVLLLPLLGASLACEDTLGRLAGVFLVTPVPYLLLTLCDTASPLQLGVLVAATLILTQREMAGQPEPRRIRFAA